jgi:hypothetical protein
MKVENKNLDTVSGAAFDFTKNFFDTYITPMIGKVTDATTSVLDRNTEIYNLQKQQAADFKKEFDENGKPLIDLFSKTVQDFSTDEFADTQARLGIGDVRNQQANADQATDRALAARGINPGSPAAIAAKTQTAVPYAVAAASQAARARDLANTQKLNLQASGANLGVTLGQQSTTSGQAAASTVQSGAGIPALNLNAVSGAQSAQYPGYDTAIKGYGTVLDAAAGVNKQAQSDATKAAASESSGFGDLIGTAIGIGAKAFMASDRRLKRNVERIGRTPNGKLNIYRFNYLWSDTPTVGYMADEVMHVYPEAVFEVGGFKVLDYSKIVSGV